MSWNTLSRLAVTRQTCACGWRKVVKHESGSHLLRPLCFGYEKELLLNVEREQVPKQSTARSFTPSESNKQI